MDAKKETTSPDSYLRTRYSVSLEGGNIIRLQFMEGLLSEADNFQLAQFIKHDIEKIIADNPNRSFVGLSNMSPVMNMVSMVPERVRNVYSEIVDIPEIIKIAFTGVNKFYEVALNMIVNSSHYPKGKVRVFADETEAMKWLNEKQVKTNGGNSANSNGAPKSDAEHRSTYRIEIEGNFARISFLRDYTDAEYNSRTAVLLAEDCEKLLSLNPNVVFKVLIDISNLVGTIGFLNKETRDTYSRLMDNERVSRIAFFGANKFYEVAIGMMMGMMKMKGKARIFATKEEALAWLKE
jgi:hypothetical protein